MFRKRGQKEIESKPATGSSPTFTPLNTAGAGADMLVHNPAPNASPALAPTGVHQEFKIAL